MWKSSWNIRGIEYQSPYLELQFGDKNFRKSRISFIFITRASISSENLKLSKFKCFKSHSYMQSCHWTKFALRKVIKQSGSIGRGGGVCFRPWDVQIIDIKWHSGNYYNHSKLIKLDPVQLNCTLFPGGNTLRCKDQNKEMCRVILLCSHMYA